MIELGNQNTSADTLDIGIYGNYNDGLSDGGASEYTGLFRDASDSTWKLFDGLESEPTTTVMFREQVMHLQIYKLVI